MPTRLPNRVKPTKLDTDATTREITDGQLSVTRIAVSTTRVTHVVAPLVRFVIIKNSGSNDIELNFGTDTGTNYFTLEKTITFPFTVNVREGVQIHFKTKSGSTEIELITWG